MKIKSLTIGLIIIFSLLFVFFTNKTENVNYVENESEEDIVTFFLYGELLTDDYIDPYLDENVEKITKKFGFIVERIAGCELTSDLEETARIQNKKSNIKMKLKYGDNWKNDFENKTKKKLFISDIDE